MPLVQMAKILITLGALIYGLAVPILEINATHVFNPEWPPHARLHEVWQLITNSSLALLALWLAWFRNEVRLASVLAILVTGGFLIAYAIRNTYGGSMILSDGSEKMISGINLGVAGFGLVIALSASALLSGLQKQRMK